MSYNLHVFNDQLGFFTNKTVSFIESIYPTHNVFLNTAKNCKNKIDEINYFSVKDFLNNSTEREYKLIIFHSYNYSNRSDIKKIKSKFPNSNIKFVWVFWSHEYYQLPEFFSRLYQGFSRKFYLRKLLSFHVDCFFQFLRGQVNFPFYLGLNAFQKTFDQFYVMGSLIKGDYELAMRRFPEVQYRFASYISVSDFPDTQLDFEKEKTDIMIGHSGTPILNHYEIVSLFSEKSIQNKIYIPLAYGKKSYIQELQREIEKKCSNLNIEFQLDFITKDAYYKRISTVGFFILNSFCQQALGNIFFFLWVGTKVFLRKETSSYMTFKEKGFSIFAIDDGFGQDALEPLTKEEQIKNRQLVESMIGDDVVSKAWLDILKINES